MADAFFLPVGDERYLATEHTVGPWDPAAAHAGPPSALLGRAVERCAPRDDVMVARVTFEILGAVPVGELTATARLARPGRSVELVEASLSAGGRDVMLARAWRIRRTADTFAGPPHDPSPPPLPEPAEIDPISGYMAAIEWRFARGHFAVPGPAAAWTRLLHPIVPDEEPTSLQRVLAVADSGNGASSVLDWREWWFINTELTVHLHREAVGEWICLDAATTITTGGVGLATSVLSDRDGPLGRGAQSLYVAHR